MTGPNFGDPEGTSPMTISSPPVPEVIPPAHPAGFAAAEPVVALSLAGSIVAYVLSLLVTHGVITGTQASSYDKTYVPVVAAGLVALLGFLARRFVSPASKLAHYKAIAERVGSDLGLTDADYQMISSIVEARLQQAFGSITLNVTGGNPPPLIVTSGGGGFSGGGAGSGVVRTPQPAGSSGGGEAVPEPEPTPVVTGDAAVDVAAATP